jgi:hypothetical protein
MRVRRSTLSIAALVLLAIALAGSPGGARGEVPGDDLWAAGRNWLSLRAGYAKASGPVTGNGGIGYGFGYSHMLSPVKLYRWTFLRQFSIGGYLHYESLEHFFSAAEIEVPATLELVRHFHWSTPLRPYLGIGTGAFYRKSYRTGLDVRNVDMGTYLTFGANSPIGGRQLLGFDGRMVRVDASFDPPNPVFGTGSGDVLVTGPPPIVERKNGTHWSAKINYTIVY